VAEVPGTDPKLKEELVMLGGHLDSWHGATGATDNAAGCSVMMEAVRILKTLNVQPRRTIRIVLWSGEEEGLLGSRAYAKNHFADTANGQWVLKAEQSKVSAYYNVDNGTGKIRGVYLQGNEAERAIFSKWLEPFNDMGAKTITINNTGGTDHLSFDRVGIPGFQFIQDEIEYDTRTHHSNMDDYDHLVPEDMKQAAIIVATFVYNTAERDEKMPRKELQPPTRNQRAF
jgi:Zn-dependent M28 family amino/carboxypeptidase